MSEPIKLGSIYDKSLNFLIGSGASCGLLPTLALGIKDGDAMVTVETLATRPEYEQDPGRTALFMHYYNSCIRPAQALSMDKISADPTKNKVVENYGTFLRTLLQVLNRKQMDDRKCNIFTTNYDSSFALAADVLLEEGHIDFVLNDGARGFGKKYLQARNFNSHLYQTSLFERHRTSIPQINLIHLHGSVHWKKQAASIVVDYTNHGLDEVIDEVAMAALTPFSAQLMQDDLDVAGVAVPALDADSIRKFWAVYNALPIVNPTKWKFHETVFEEHYYQMLRMLSYELEKPNAVLITFGFSFADEHILTIIKRALANPTLMVYLPPQDGFLFLDREKFAASFAGDVPADEANFMADSQVPWGVEALAGAVTVPAWKSKPSWYLVATEDKMIPPPAQQMMAKRAGATVVEVAGSHAIYVSKPDAVAKIIEQAAQGKK